MEKPKSLKVISAILIALGVVRIVMGIIVFVGLKGSFEQQPNLIYPVIWDNLVAGMLIWISGLLLLKGKGIGRYLLIIALVVIWVANFIYDGSYSIGGLVIFGVLITVLFAEDNIRAYFSHTV